ncbi:methyltransferase type 11 [Rhodothermaceae bacterium RA]|nr:methyltransferase type 11 [Rhodothermaceae bacterium RA]
MPPPSFATRSQAREMMDDFSITDDRLGRALRDLQVVNRWLGGYAGTMAVLAPYLRARPGHPTRILDLGTGGADFPAYLVRWAAARGLAVSVVGVDANPATVRWARQRLDRTLPPSLRERVRLEVGDALALEADAGCIDVAVASLFLHHFDAPAAVALLREMQRVASAGLVVNDLHRHPVAYHAIRVLAHGLPVSPMFRHDAPLSVLRGFRRDELAALAAEAGLPAVRLRWRWAFRWILTTLPEQT